MCKSVPVVIGFKRAVLIQTQVFCLLVTKLCQVGIKRGQMQTRNIFIWKTKTSFNKKEMGAHTEDVNLSVHALHSCRRP